MARTPSREEIERRAYEIYERRGCEDGHAEDDWFEAEKELVGQPVGSDSTKSESRIKAAVAQAMQQKSSSARSTRN
jgi:hypothetical protein